MSAPTPTPARSRFPWGGGAVLRVLLAASAALLLVVPLVGLGRVDAATEVRLVAAGDFGARAETRGVLRGMAALAPDAALALGDLAYRDLTPESAWCAFVKSELGEGFPFELVAGNHESLDVADGQINDFSACLPNQVPGIAGTYGREYVMDLPRGAPLVRVIQTSPKLTFEDGLWNYAAGDAHLEWLSAAIDEGRARGARWIVVTSHVPCVSVGVYSCPSNRDFYELLLAKRVDLVLHGHEHAYMRTHQLRNAVTGCPALAVGTVDADCIADSDNAYAAGAGTVFATVGTGGTPLRNLNLTDTEAGYFAASSGLNRTPTFGLLDVRATDTSLQARFVPTSGAGMTDAFSITVGAPQPVPALAQDRFERTVATGWGTAETGGAWTANSSALSVAGGRGRITTAPGSTRGAHLRAVSSAATDLRATMSPDKLATGGGLYVSVAARAVTGAGDYRAKYVLRSDGRIALSLVRTSATGAETALGAAVLVPNLSYAAGSTLAVRVQATGTAPTTIRAKVWAAGAAEPSAWTLTATDATAALQVPGGVGVMAYLSSAATNAPIVLSVDDLAAVAP